MTGLCTSFREAMAVYKQIIHSGIYRISSACHLFPESVGVLKKRTGKLIKGANRVWSLLAHPSLFNIRGF